MAAETGKTPGQVLHESLQRSASAESGIPLEQYARWDEILQRQRDRMEDVARDVIDSAVDVLQRVALGTDDRLAHQAREALGKVDKLTENAEAGR